MIRTIFNRNKSPIRIIFYPRYPTNYRILVNRNLTDDKLIKRALEARAKLKPLKHSAASPVVANASTSRTAMTAERTASKTQMLSKLSEEKNETNLEGSTNKDENISNSSLKSSFSIAKVNLAPKTEGTSSSSSIKHLRDLSSNSGITSGGGSMRNLRAAHSEQCPPPPCPPPPCPPGGWRRSNWLLAAGALGALAGLIYFLTRPKPVVKQSKCKENCEQRCEACGGLKEGSIHGVKNPPCSADLPDHVPYLLIGGGTASFSAFRAIKCHDPTAKVLIVTEECFKPYMRPPLSKELWYSNTPAGQIPRDLKFQQWNGAERSLFYEPDEFYVNPVNLMDCGNGGVAVATGYRVRKIDAARQVAILSDGKEIAYDECLIATGCSPKTSEVFESAPVSAKNKIMQFRTPQDYARLRRVAETKRSIAVIGSGFLGSEIACSLARYGKDKGLEVFQIFHESGNMAKILPEYLSKWTTNRVRELGVCVIPQAQVSQVSSNQNGVKLTLNNGLTVLTDQVVVCLGCNPNTDLATLSGLEIDNKLGGFVVNSELEARRHIFVAGDASCFYDPLLGRRRVEHHDHSVISGRLAGENMVGLKKPYTHQSMFWSDLGPDIGYEGIGICDSSLPTVGVFAKTSSDECKSHSVKLEEVSNDKLVETSAERNQISDSCVDDNTDNYGKGVVFYLKDGKIVGVLLWNLFNRIGIARQIIKENRKFEDLNEVAKLFEIHS